VRTLAAGALERSLTDPRSHPLLHLHGALWPFPRTLAGMRIADDQPKSVVFWDGREDLGSPFKRACNSIIIGNVRLSILAFLPLELTQIYSAQTKNPKGVPPQMIFCLLNVRARLAFLRRRLS